MSRGQAAPDERPKHEDPSIIDLVVGPGHEADNQTFGQMLATFRELAGLSRAAAAASLDVSAEYLRLIELGRRTPALGQMRTVMELYSIDGEVGRLQPAGDRPDLILVPPQADEPITVEFASRIREARRRGVAISREFGSNQDAHMPKESRALELGFIVSLLTGADDLVLAQVYELLQSSTAGAQAERPLSGPSRVSAPE